MRPPMTSSSNAYEVEQCEGCGSTETLQSLQGRGFVACCPDRRGAPTLVEGFGPSTTEIIRARLALRTGDVS